MRRTHFYRRVVLAVVSLFLTSNVFSQNGVIAGKVAHANEALQSATISIGKKTTYTNEKGEFSFSVPAGSYKLIITHVGYKTIERSVVIKEGSAANLEFEMTPNEQLGEIVVLGSRSFVHRSNLNTPVPVDAFSSAQLQETGQTSLMQMLNFVAPALRTSLQIATEPVTLRGLDPDHTLILLNSTRYHNIAYINPGVPVGQLGRGSAGNDLNTIPFSAIEKVEILRDGASAQYGSDAIAGVMDIRLKESTGKTSVNLHLGQQYKNDGETVTVGLYRGVDLKKKGFVTFSADIRYRGPTYRGGEYQGTVYKNYPQNATQADIARIKSSDDSTVQARGFDRTSVSNSGTSRLISGSYLINGAYKISNKTELFWTGAFNDLVLYFTNVHVLPKNMAAINTELYSDGFKSRVKSNVWNIAGIAGIRGVTRNEIHWLYNSAYGVNTDRYNSENTNNASQQYTLGKNAPTAFYTGTQTYQQLTNTIQFTKNIFNSGNKIKNVQLAWGGEMRFENFKTKAGEEASWKNYDSSFKKQGGSQLSQVVSPDDVVNKSRSVICVYGDMETELNDRFLINLASRFEYYSDFGGNLAGKLAVRYKVIEKISLRGSISNGFRAPSMQQRYFNLITYGQRVTGGTSTGTRRGIFNNDHEVTKLFGVPSLEAEKSLNFSGGATATISRQIYLTIDAYWIQIKNRIVLSGAFDRKLNAEVDSLLKDPSLNDYSYVEQVSFFANAINTRTYGTDIVLNGRWNIKKAQLIAVLAANFTRTNLFGDIKVAANLSATKENQNTLFSEEQRIAMEKGAPLSKIILSLNYKHGEFGFMVRNTRFDKTTVFYADNRPTETYPPKILTDISASYTPKSWLTVTAGANNIFDVYPDPVENYVNTNEGRLIYSVNGSPFGFMGGYYYVGMNFNF